MFRFLRVVRIVVELVVFALFVFGSVYAGDILLTRVQFLPVGLKAVALVTLAPIAVFVLFALLAFFFGRLYCSLLCPWGILQDIVSRAFRLVSFKRLPSYKSRKNLRTLRYSVLVGVLISAVGGFMFPLLLLEPFSMFWRIQNSLFHPLIVLVNNYLYDRFELVDPLKHVPSASLSIVIASVSLLAIFVLAAIWGRWFCNTLCPAGALLGLLSRFSVFKLKLGDKCVACGACAKVCKTGCIDVKNKSIDFERCVMCMDCGAACRFGAVNFSLSQRKTGEDTEVDPSRRNFMLGMSIAASSALLIPPAIRSASSEGEPPIMPPGAGKIADFTSRCTACHLCVSSCPGRVIKPAVMAYGLSGMMVPKLDFSAGMCEFECVTCSNICPSGALRPLSVEEKRLTRIGLVKYYKERCIVVTDGYDCGACAEHCPTGALAMVSWKNGLRIPQVNPDLCIGCGCCEHICPARPAKAVIVDGLAVQEKAVKPKGKAESRTGNLDFPF